MRIELTIVVVLRLGFHNVRVCFIYYIAGFYTQNVVWWGVAWRGGARRGVAWRGVAWWGRGVARRLTVCWKQAVYGDVRQEDEDAERQDLIHQNFMLTENTKKFETDIAEAMADHREGSLVRHSSAEQARKFLEGVKGEGYSSSDYESESESDTEGRVTQGGLAARAASKARACPLEPPRLGLPPGSVPVHLLANSHVNLG